MNRKRSLLLLAAVIAVFVVVLAAYRLRNSNMDEGIVLVSGNIEVRAADIGFKIAGRVTERLVSEGERVGAGQVIARLDDSALVQEQALRRAELRAAQAALAELEAGFRDEDIAQARAAMERAGARLDELLAGSRPQEIAAAEAAVRNIRAQVELLKIERDRQMRLLKTEAISEREFDRVETEYDRALAGLSETEEKLKLVRAGPRKEQIRQAQASFREAEARYKLFQAGHRAETIEQARARVEQAEAALALVDVRLNDATVEAPLSGIVLSHNVEPGEYVAPGTPVVTLGDLENVWLRAYIDETDLERVKWGQTARVTTDGLPGKVYDGRVAFISSSAEFTPKNIQTHKERVKLVYRVKIDIPNPRLELKPGMPADAEIMTHADD
jgi:HlyD family secretion protein